MPLSNPLKEGSCNVLTDEERKIARATVVKTSLTHLKNRSKPENSVHTRRRNLAAHLGVDETISTEDLQMINIYALPRPSAAQTSLNASSG